LTSKPPFLFHQEIGFKISLAYLPSKEVLESEYLAHDIKTGKDVKRGFAPSLKHLRLGFYGRVGWISPTNLASGMMLEGDDYNLKAIINGLHKAGSNLNAHDRDAPTD